MDSRKTVRRQSGIELLRIIAMYLIVTHHMVNHNSFDFLGQPGSFRQVVLSLFQFVPGKIGIALFFIASAWFLSTGTANLKNACRKIWVLECEILFWSIAGLVFQLLIDPEVVHFQQVIMAFFPTITQLWWYTTCYALFLIFLPFINLSLRRIGQNVHKKLAVVMVVVWGVSSVIPYSSMGIGLNLIAFMYVYTLITYYRWYMQPVSTRFAVVAVLICGILLLAWNILFGLLYTDEYASEYQAILYILDREWSLPVLGVSFGMFIVFSRMRFHSRLVNSVASWTLGVYLITDHPFVRELLWTQWFAFDKYYQTRLPIVWMLAISAFVFVVALMLEAIRKSLFAIIFNREGVFERMWGIAVHTIGSVSNIR